MAVRLPDGESLLNHQLLLPEQNFTHRTSARSFCLILVKKKKSKIGESLYTKGIFFRVNLMSLFFFPLFLVILIVT